MDLEEVFTDGLRHNRQYSTESQQNHSGTYNILASDTSQKSSTITTVTFIILTIFFAIFLTFKITSIYDITGKKYESLLIPDETFIPVMLVYIIVEIVCSGCLKIVFRIVLYCFYLGYFGYARYLKETYVKI